jgi:phosphopantothenoylcysteine decarboxylase/phosphopantothenate--cysteine ligase
MPTDDHCTYRLLLTAGPTHEPIDAVRYIANRSSGRMGIAIADAAARRGIETTLLLGPTMLEPPEGTRLTVERFRTTGDLRGAMARHWPGHDVLIMAAAVADYRPVEARDGAKMPRGGEHVHLELEPTPDLLAEIARESRPDQCLVGFALEPAAQLAASARDKLHRKGVHAMRLRRSARRAESAAATANPHSAIPPLSGSGFPIRPRVDLESRSRCAFRVDRDPPGGVVPPLPCAIFVASADVGGAPTSRAGGAASCGLPRAAGRPLRRPHPAGCHKTVVRGKGFLYAGFALKTAQVTGGIHAASRGVGSISRSETHC